jgi:hypothetical protein
MKPATIFAVLAFTLLPSLAAAACRGHDETAASCMAGTVWDETKGTCVEKPTS